MIRHYPGAAATRPETGLTGRLRAPTRYYSDVAGFQRAYTADATTEFFAGRLVSCAMQGHPTRGYHYSNTNYILAG